MKPVLHLSQTREGHILKEELQANLLMNIAAKILNKKWQTESNNISERSFTMIKSALFQECRDGSTYIN
jgi:hypothetical protein